MKKVLLVLAALAIFAGVGQAGLFNRVKVQLALPVVEVVKVQNVKQVQVVEAVEVVEVKQRVKFQPVQVVEVKQQVIKAVEPVKVQKVFRAVNNCH